MEGFGHNEAMCSISSKFLNSYQFPFLMPTTHGRDYLEFLEILAIIIIMIIDMLQ